MQRWYIMLASMCLAIVANAQVVSTKYYKNNGRQVDSQDSADLKCVISAQQGSAIFNVSEYLANGKLIFQGYTRFPDHPDFTGKCTAYYPSGNKKAVMNYAYGKLSGLQYYYYPSGQLAETRKYAKKKHSFKENFTYRVIAFNDSAGNRLVTNGKGQYETTDPDGREEWSLSGPCYVRESGFIKHNSKDGLWKGIDSCHQVTFSENYQSGKLIVGTAISANGKKSEYAIRQAPPEFPGGIVNFYQYLYARLHYPPGTDRSNLNGGAVVTFNIDQNGRPEQIRIIQSAGQAIDNDIIRVISACPDWRPAIHYGVVESQSVGLLVIGHDLKP